MKILVLNGSPKKVSDTMCLTNAFLRGVQKADDTTEVKIVNVIEKNIKPCLGCFACWKNLDFKCVQNDDQNEILADILESDVTIWSFPLYCYSFPSHLKAVLDRTIPLVRRNMAVKGDRVVHKSDVDFSAKKFIVICGCGFPSFEKNFQPLILQCKNCFGGNPIMLCVPETPMLNVPQAKPLGDLLLDKVEKAGGEFVLTKKLTTETIAEIEKPMIPQADYIAIVNGG